MQASIIAVMNQKGGTGKTTTTINLGVALAEAGKKVLLLDIDPQGSLTWHLGVVEPPQDLADVFFGDADWKSTFVEKEKLTLVPSTIELANTELSLATHPDRTRVLQKLLTVLRSDFDFILLDCAPSLSLLTINALTVADQILIPLRPEILALKGLDLMSRTVQNVRKTYNPSLKVLGIVLVMVDLRMSITKEIYEYLIEQTPYKVFDAHIELDEKTIEAPSFGTSTLSYAPDSPSSRAYRRLAKEILELF